MENHLAKSTLSTPDRDSRPDHLVIAGLVECDISALDRAAIEEAHFWSREAAFTYAISSAGVAYAVTAACSRGNISECGCDPGHKSRKEPAPQGWKWGGCSADVGYGMKFARRFLDAREIEGDERSLMNLHNNKAGRKLLTEASRRQSDGGHELTSQQHRVLAEKLIAGCESEPSHRVQVSRGFRELHHEDLLEDAATVQADRGQPHEEVLPRTRRGGRAEWVTALQAQAAPGQSGCTLVLKRPPPRGFKAVPALLRVPRRSDLVFLQDSPNYCEKDPSKGSLGTSGRLCNRTSRGTDGCDLMCCGRGYNTHQYTKTWQCHCKFHWCCYVNCDTCSERTEEYTCKSSQP
uniref:Protein Wnt n=1 Tax=Timema shepardi TaxID=629360 RepID=A0A7R9APG0_TIMSH|nr:unnamed protein product [Timema shepardi]